MPVVPRTVRMWATRVFRRISPLEGALIMFGEMKRITYIVGNMDVVTEFYRDILELRPIFDPKTPPPEWIEFNAGPCRIALKKSMGEPGSPATDSRITFYSEDVGKTRDELVAKGAELSEVESDGRHESCEGKDPEGNLFEISNR